MIDVGTEMRIAGLRKENARAWAEVERLTADVSEWKAAADTEARLRRDYYDKAERLRALLKELDDDMWAEKREHYRNSGLGRRVHTELSSQKP